MKSLLIVLLLIVAGTSYAGVLMQEWTEGNVRYCKYSDGTVLSISFSSTCPRTN